MPPQAETPIRIVLLTLSGDSRKARTALSERYPNADIAEADRALLESGSIYQRLRRFRELRADVLAVATERLAWQRGQNAFMLLGALTAARGTIIFDAHGGWREEPGARSFVTAPLRLAQETVISSASMRRAEKQLKQLEVAAQNGAQRRPGSNRRTAPEPPAIVYLRSSPGPGTQAGGAASHINGFVDAAIDLNARLSIVSNDEIAGLDSGKLPLKIIWPTPVGTSRAAFDVYNNMVFSAAATAEIERQQPDFIYQRYARFSWAGVAASVKIGRPLFLEYNGSEVWVGRYWDRVGNLELLARFERLNLKAAARIFVVSAVEKQNLIRAGVDETRIIVNPNGVNVDQFRPGIGGERLRDQLGVTRDQMLVGFIGTFGPWHGVEVLANAIAMVPAAARMRFLLIGTGALRSRVEQLLREAGVQENVIFTGAVSHDQVPAMLDACDILVSPHVPLEDGSDFFGSPTKLFEYMAMGKAIVASRLGQIGDVLVDQESALLVEPGNERELANAIVRLSEAKELRAQLGAAARRAAIARHTWKQNAQRVIDQYEALAD